MTQLSKRTPTASTLTRLLETPDLVRQIQSLPAPALLRTIQKIGLEDSGELLELATNAQLTQMLDEELWHSGKSGEELDPERLMVWLGALAELGTSRAAKRLAGMDEEFLCHILSQYLNAIDLEAMQFMQVNVIGDSWQDERLEKMLEDCNSQEIGGALVIAKPGAPWEYLQPLLLDLDQEDQSLCARVLHRLLKVTEAKAEREGGLFEVLSEEEMLGNDAAFSRDLRRTQDGYVSADDAKAFLGWMKATPAAKIAQTADPVSKDYFRKYEGAPLMQSRPDSAPPLNPLLLELIGDEKKAEPPLKLSFEKGESGFFRLLARRPSEQPRFLMELNFLAQALMRAETEAHEPLRESEAAEQVLESCERGLKQAGKKGAKLSAIQLFGLGMNKD